MALFRKPGRKVWNYQVKINGKTWCRSTGETDRKRAEAKVPRLRKLAQLHRDAPSGSLRLGNAIVREVARLEADVSRRQAERVGSALQNFLDWTGDIPLDRIDGGMVEEYQRKRLQEVARSTAEKEICYLIRTLRLNGFNIQRPSSKPGKATPNRAFSREELDQLFGQVPERLRLLYAMLLATRARLAEMVPSDASTHKPLLKSEVDLEKRTALIRSAKTRSVDQGTIRLLSLPEELITALEDQINAIEGPYVFEKLHNSARDFDATLIRANIEKIDILGRKLTVHSFRHTYATLMAESVGHNPFILKEILGHKRISTTEQYCHPTAPVISLPFDLLSQRGWTQGVDAKKKACRDDRISRVFSMVGDAGIEPATSGM